MRNNKKEMMMKTVTVLMLGCNNDRHEGTDRNTRNLVVNNNSLFR